jgi:succinoglycan biosynthesis protein ExoM
MLRTLLKSLCEQICADFDVQVIIIDNDPAASAKSVVEEFEGCIDIAYHMERRAGIAEARNTALRVSSADLVAFIDDDEVAPPSWISTLRKAVLDYDADVVLGPVHPLFSENTPAWVVRHPLFNQPSPPTGTRIHRGGTGNAMLRRTGFGIDFPLFNVAYGLTGGEDTDFFYRAYADGKKLIHCREALVYETVLPERTKIGWMTRRAFRTGRGFSEILVARWSTPRRLSWYALKLVQVTAALPLLPILRAVSYERYAVLLTRIYAATGQLSVPLGYPAPTAEYAHLHEI